MVRRVSRMGSRRYYDGEGAEPGDENVTTSPTSRDLLKELANANRIVYEATINSMVQSLVSPDGNPKVNFVVLLSIPLAIQSAMMFGRMAFGYATRYFYASRKKGVVASRYIRSSLLHDPKSNHRNDILIKALNIYVTEFLGQSDISLETADAQLNSVDDTASKMTLSATIQKRFPGYEEPHNEDKNSEHSQLKRLSVMTTLTLNVPVDLGNGIIIVKELEEMDSYEPEELEQSASGSNRRSSKQSKELSIQYVLTSKNPGGAQRIDAFLKAVYETYVSKMSQVLDNGRYLFQMVRASSASGSTSSSSRAGSSRRPYPYRSSGIGAESDGLSGEPSIAMHYKRYLLTDRKSFDNLFFPRKGEVLTLLDDFKNKTGKYSIPSYPDKLGLLLHGPPGSGKTSFIKALSLYTNRHIVRIDLAKIETNEQLASVIFDGTYVVPEHPFPFKFSFKDIIFVFEDIDTMTDVVLKRSVHPRESSSSQLRTSSRRSTTSVPSSARKAKPSDEERDKDKEEGEQDEDDEKARRKKLEESWARREDKLNLGELLNVLDGVVDTPDRMVVMTTNREWALDSALIRPGRIDKAIHLNFMRAQEAQELIKLYFPGQELSVDQSRKLSDMLGTGEQDQDIAATGLCPCDIEQKCAESLTIDTLLDAISVVCSSKAAALAEPIRESFREEKKPAGKPIPIDGTTNVNTGNINASQGDSSSEVGSVRVAVVDNVALSTEAPTSAST